MAKLNRFLLAGLALFSSSAFATQTRVPPVDGSYVAFVSSSSLSIKQGDRGASDGYFCSKLLAESTAITNRTEGGVKYEVQGIKNGVQSVYGGFTAGEGGCATYGTITFYYPDGSINYTNDTVFHWLHLQKANVCADGSDLQYESSTGEWYCLAPQCEAGENTTRSTFAYFGQEVNPPQTICKNQCSFDIAASSGVSIGISVPDTNGLYDYTVRYVGNGNSCPADTPPEPHPPEPDNCPKGFALGADGTTCYRLPDNPKPDDSDPIEGGGDTGGVAGVVTTSL